MSEAVQTKVNALNELGCEIDKIALKALAFLDDEARALELLNEVQEKIDDPNYVLYNPSGFIRKAVGRENKGTKRPREEGAEENGKPAKKPAVELPEAVKAKVDAMNKAGCGFGFDVKKALAGLDDESRALELLDEVQAKVDDPKYQLYDPSGFIKKAIARGPKPTEAEQSEIKAKVTELNGKGIWGEGINDDALKFLVTISVEKATAILTEVEEKGKDVKNVSSFVSAAARRAFQGKGKGKRR